MSELVKGLIIGPPGVGKTTFIKLLSNKYDGEKKQDGTGGFIDADYEKSTDNDIYYFINFFKDSNLLLTTIPGDHDENIRLRRINFMEKSNFFVIILSADETNNTSIVNQINIIKNYENYDRIQEFTQFFIFINKMDTIINDTEDKIMIFNDKLNELKLFIEEFDDTFETHISYGSILPVENDTEFSRNSEDYLDKLVISILENV